MIEDRIYLDHNATTGVKYAVRVAIAEAMGGSYNPSSVHSFGREARAMLDKARNKILQMAGAEGHTVIFTSSGTESNNLAIRGFKGVDSVLASAIEHPSVLKAIEKRTGGIIPVDDNGIVHRGVLQKILENTKGRSLVSIMLANNETGVIQPIKEIAEMVFKCGGYIHCDASQAFGKIPVNFNDLNVDMMTLSAHKFGGPQGIAALIIKKGLEVDPLIVGGAQENKMRAGTENVSAIVGFGVACDIVTKMDSKLRDYLEKKIKKLASDSVIFGENVDRLPNTTCIAMPNMDSQTQLISFDLAGIAVSSGAACSSGKVASSHVLKAMGVEQYIVKNAIRVSLGVDTLKEEVDRFIEVWKGNYSTANAQYEQQIAVGAK